MDSTQNNGSVITSHVSLDCLLLLTYCTLWFSFCVFSFQDGNFRLSEYFTFETTERILIKFGIGGLHKKLLGWFNFYSLRFKVTPN
jgi:hypothetical protein